MAEPINFRVQFEGTDEAKRDVDSVSSSVQNLGRKEQEASRATDQFVAGQEAASRSSQQVTQNTQAQSLQVIALTQKVSAAANAIQTLATSFGGEGEAAGLLGKIAASSAATAQLGAALGPQGALVGGILGAVIPAFQAFIAKMEETRDYAQELQDELERIRNTFDELVSQRERARSEAARERFLEQGTGSVAEQESFVEVRQQQLAAIQAQIDVVNAGRVTRENVERLTELNRQATEARRDLMEARYALEEAQVQQQLDAEEMLEALQEAANVTEETTRQPARRGGGGRRVDQGDEEERLRAEEEQRKLLLQIEADSAAKQEEMNELLRQENEEREKILRTIEAESAAKERQMEDERRRAEEELELQEQLREKLQEAKVAAEEAAEAQMKQIQSVNEVIVGGLTDALSAVMSGQKTAEEAFAGMLASFLAYISEMAALEAAVNFAQAISAFAQYRYDAGAQHLAAGVAFTAVAVAAGAGAAALSAPATPSAAGPEEGRDTGGRESGGGQVIINWNSPVVTATTRAELGREMGHMIRAGQVRYG